MAVAVAQHAPLVLQYAEVYMDHYEKLIQNVDDIRGSVGQMAENQLEIEKEIKGIDSRLGAAESTIAELSVDVKELKGIQ